MYEAFFQLKQRPFAAAPQPERYFPAQSVEAAYHALARCVDRAEGPGVLIGGTGTGKSLLMEMLSRRFIDRFAVVLLSCGSFTTRRELLQAILYEMQMPYRGLDEGEMRLALFQRLDPNPHCVAGMLLLVDEAQRLPLRLLEELRTLGNYSRDGQPRVRLIMAGTRSLEERLANPKLDSLAQRLAVRSYLAPLERGETAAYVRSQIAVLGGQADQIFTADALDAIHQATAGIPRLINQLGDHALVLAYAGGRCQIDRNRVEEAWSDLQQLPAPWNEAEADGQLADVNVIEFGELDDEDEPEALTFNMQQMFSAGTSPALKLDEISAQLASLDDEFDLPEPAEAFPQMMHCDSSMMQCDPFAETFQEEEVIVDRYASAEAALADYQSVTSIEGAMLSSLLEPYMQPAPRPQLSVAAEPTNSLHSVTIAAPAPGVPLLVDDVRWADSCPRKQPSAADRLPGWQVGQSQSQVCESLDDCESLADLDEGMIVVENDPQVPRPAGSQSGAKRQEYCQLFAKLRRG